jgi:hypothetical protein
MRMTKMKNNLKLIFEVLAGLTLIIFLMLLYKKIESWISTAVGDINWALIIIGILLVIFVIAGFLSKGKIMKKFK